MVSLIYRLQARRSGAPRAERPAFGYGRGGRPLWSARDRDAEQIRRVLRRAGLRDVSKRHAGFAVEGGEGSYPFLVGCTSDGPRGKRDAALARSALTASGYLVSPDVQDEQILEIQTA